MNEDNLWSVHIEEDEYVVRLVIDRPCDSPKCSCSGEGYTTQYEIIERKKYKELPEQGSLEECQLKWILAKIAGHEGLGAFPK